MPLMKVFENKGSAEGRLLNKIRKFFLKTIFLLSCFLFFLIFFNKAVNACSAGQSCGQCGGNACTQPTAGQNCTSLGSTYDCSPCYSCSPSGGGGGGGGGGSSGTTCGGWCQSQVGHSDPPWCACNSSSSSPGYTLVNCTSSGITDCSTCCAFTTSGGGGGGGGSSTTCTPGTWDSANCRDCASDGTWGSSCGSFGPGGSAHAAEWCACEYKCLGYHSTNCGGTAAPGEGGSGSTTQDCGTICSAHGSVGASGCYCSSGSCPSPLVSYGQSSDCAVCCSWPAVNSCQSSAPPPPPPTCTISLSPSSLEFQLGNNELLTANVSVQNGSLSQVNFSSGNSAVASLSLTSVSSPPYRTQVTGQSVGSTSITAQAILSPSGSCSTSVVVSVGNRSWFQTQGGDIYTGGNLADIIPETATDRNLSLKLFNWPGIISHQDTDGVNLGSGFSSDNTLNNWLTQSKYEGKPYGSFQYFKKKFAMQMAEENYSSSDSINAPGEDKVYYAKSSRTLSGNWALGDNRWIVILVEGDVYVNTDIIVPKGSFLSIAATGNIVFNRSVTKAQGMFVAAGNIDTSTGDTAFEGQGTFSTSQFILGRDFDDARNGTEPAETFIARPDFIMSSYKDADHNLWYSNFLWKELAP